MFVFSVYGSILPSAMTFKIANTFLEGNKLELGSFSS